MTNRLNVVAIGNAIVDVVAQVDDDFLQANGVDRGVMTLIDETRARSLYDAMPPAREISGGSAANTAAAAAGLGASAGFIGTVREDTLGKIFSHDIQAIGVEYRGPFTSGGPETSRCLVLVSPNGDRSMNTFLGASTELLAADLDIDMLRRGDWLYLEGYLFDTAEAKQAYARAIEATREGGGRTSITLSDPFCVDRHRDDFRRLIASDIDLLFANRDELLSLYQTDDLESALDKVAEDCDLAAITMSEDGAVIVRGDQRSRVGAKPVDVVDTTGAGDMFAAGFLAGLSQGADDARAAEMGCAVAGHIIGQIGARSEADLKDLVAAA